MQELFIGTVEVPTQRQPLKGSVHTKGQKISKKNMLSWILPKNERWGNFMY